jgi:ATP-dependent exoDNAse (exonuclease V) beta subunit
MIVSLPICPPLTNAFRTLYEAKGLEFSDVLLYNFFRDSPAGESEWRVVLNRIEKSKGDTFTAPRFDETRHAVICTELKFLYVGITRARNHCWMWDDSPKSNPMKVRTLICEASRPCLVFEF